MGIAHANRVVKNAPKVPCDTEKNALSFIGDPGSSHLHCEEQGGKRLPEAVGKLRGSLSCA